MSCHKLVDHVCNPQIYYFQTLLYPCFSLYVFPKYNYIWKLQKKYRKTTSPHKSAQWTTKTRMMKFKRYFHTWAASSSHLNNCTIWSIFSRRTSTISSHLKEQHRNTHQRMHSRHKTLWHWQQCFQVRNIKIQAFMKRWSKLLSLAKISNAAENNKKLAINTIEHSKSPTSWSSRFLIWLSWRQQHQRQLQGCLAAASRFLTLLHW